MYLTMETPLLTTHLFISKKQPKGLKHLLNKITDSGILIKQYGPEEKLLDLNPNHPRVYLSIGDNWEEFQTLNSLPLYERRRWLHYSSPDQVQPHNLFFCWLAHTDPLPENKIIPQNRFSSDTPLVSIFTASYKSKEKINRPYQSLLKQTYTNWEWVIVDDSDDADETYNNYLLSLTDPRVRRYRQDSRNGYIGAVKRYAAGLCKGEILVEVDHDDELTTDCLEKIVNAFQQHPECGFAFGDCTEVYEGSHESHWYGWDCGFGTCLYYRVWVHEMNRWQNVYKNTTTNSTTISHLVGLPNHPRAWTRDCYHLIGGHRTELLVADDYDLLVRTFLCTKYVAVPDLLYIQYRNENGNNSTFLRNNQIQTLVAQIYNYYYRRIEERINELGLPDDLQYHRVWETSENHPVRKSAHLTQENQNKKSILFPIPFSNSVKVPSQLLNMLQEGLENNFRDFEIVVIGRIPPEIEVFAARAPTGAIRWWEMKDDDSLEACIEYSKYCASCAEKIVILPQ
ncbi:glycosyltransferase [Pseudoneobacillus sp. C159]